MRELIERLERRPEPFEGGDADLWTDPSVVPQLLSAHLDPDTDAASRRPARIAAEVDWLVETLDLGQGARVLDLGCGPGLYSSALAGRGCAVTGVDISRHSLEHARRAAAEAGLEITYLETDYRALEDRSGFDAAIIVYLDFGVLSEGDRREVLRRARRALKPRGRLAFDVVTTAAGRPEGATWAAHTGGGFWRRGPHFVLERKLDYPSLELSCAEHAVIDGGGAVTVYRIWEQRFTRDGLERLLHEAGFEVTHVAADLTGADWTPEAETMAVVAVRSGS